MSPREMHFIKFTSFHKITTYKHSWCASVKKVSWKLGIFLGRNRKKILFRRCREMGLGTVWPQNRFGFVSGSVWVGNFRKKKRLRNSQTGSNCNFYKCFRSSFGKIIMLDVSSADYCRSNMKIKQFFNKLIQASIHFKNAFNQISLTLISSWTVATGFNGSNRFQTASNGFNRFHLFKSWWSRFNRFVTAFVPVRFLET